MIDPFAEVNIVPEDQVKSNVIPDRTVANLTWRPDEKSDTEIYTGKIGKGDNAGKPYLSVNFEVPDGPFAKRRADLFLVVDGADRQFRKAYQIVTGEEIASGARADFAKFKEGLRTGVFEGTLGPRKTNGEVTDFVKVYQLNKRVGERSEADIASSGSAAAVPADLDDYTGSGDDIPF